MKYAREWITYPVGTTEWDENRLIDIPADEIALELKNISNSILDYITKF